MPRKPLRLAAVVAAAGALIASTAFAATPKHGAYLWTSKDKNSSVYLAVDGKPRKIVNSSISTKKCKNGAPIAAAKDIKIKPSGKFHYKGPGHFFDGSSTQLTVRGKFVTRRKAKGRAHIKSCGVTVKFTAKYENNQQG
jgi:Neuraminidase (sialidase)